MQATPAALENNDIKQANIISITSMQIQHHVTTRKLNLANHKWDIQTQTLFGSKTARFCPRRIKLNKTYSNR